MKLKHIKHKNRPDVAEPDTGRALLVQSENSAMMLRENSLSAGQTKFYGVLGRLSESGY